MLDERRLDLLVQVNNCLTRLTFEESFKARYTYSSEANIHRVNVFLSRFSRG